MADLFDADAGSPYAFAPLSVAQAFVLGRTCGEHVDGDIANCPYPEGTHEHAAWKRGFAIPALPRDAGEDERPPEPATAARPRVRIGSSQPR